jgi:uncharacterized protein YndB with AHSA1/START domain
MERKIQYETVVNANVEEVWRAWTVEEGVRSFFAPQAHIDLRIGGVYELTFNSDENPGLRGSEGCTILSFLPHDMLSFTWNAPPEFPDIRALGCATWVVIQLYALPENLTRVRLSHLGWGEGDAWEAVYSYFTRAWKIVLDRLVVRYTSGPIEWDKL